MDVGQSGSPWGRCKGVFRYSKSSTNFDKIRFRNFLALLLCGALICSGCSTTKLPPMDPMTTKVVPMAQVVDYLQRSNPDISAQRVQSPLLSEPSINGQSAGSFLLTNANDRYESAYGQLTSILDTSDRTKPTRVSDLRHQLDLATEDIGQLSVLNRAAPFLADGLQAQTISSKLRLIEPLYREAAQRVSALSNHYGLYVGSAFSLEGDGSWSPGAEVMLRFENQATSDALFCPRKVFIWCRRFTEISYQQLGAIDTDAVDAAVTNASNSSQDNAGLLGIVQTQSQNLSVSAEETGNPFIKGGGYFRINTGAKWHFQDWMGLALGAGLSSVPDTKTSPTKLKGRVFGGVSAMTMYSDGALSQVFVGVAHDRFWERAIINRDGEREVEENYGRLVVDGLFMIPGLQPKGFNIVGRLYGDMPLSGRGPSELRISLLFYQPFSDWQSLFNPLKRLRLENIHSGLTSRLGL